jgi:hypothetical protein
MAAAEENSKDGIAAENFEGASGKAAVCFHVSDLGFYGIASSQQLFQRGCEAAFGPCDQNLGGFQSFAQKLG